MPGRRYLVRPSAYFRYRSYMLSRRIFEGTKSCVREFDSDSDLLDLLLGAVLVVTCWPYLSLHFGTAILVHLRPAVQ